MSNTFFTFSSILFTLLISNEVKCVENKASGVSLECWPYWGKLNFTHFKIDMYFSVGRRIHQLLRPRNILTELIGFDPRRKTVVIVHGFLANVNNRLIVQMRNEFLLLRNINVIVVDWEEGSKNILKYPFSVLNTRTVAQYITKVISNSMGYWMNKGIGPKDWAPLHVIGHSLGAHVAGLTGRYLRRRNIIVDRVTALDPAEPCFENPRFPLRLRMTDANFIDVIHTDVAPVKKWGFGIYEPMGHADFYVNGGTYQPGCKKILPDKHYTKPYLVDPDASSKDFQFLQILIHTLVFDGICAHTRAVELFTESVRQLRLNQCRFWARPWRLGSKKPINNTPCTERTCQQLGINSKRSVNGGNNIYYVATTNVKPFCNI